MGADISRKQKKKDKKQKEIELEKFNNMTEVEKEAQINADAVIVDDSVRADDVAEHKLVDDEVINELASNEEDKSKHFDLFYKDKMRTALFMREHPDFVRHEIQILWCIIAVLLILMTLAIHFDITKNDSLEASNRMIEALNVQIDTERTTEVALQGQIDDLNSKVSVLSESLALKTSELEEALEDSRKLRIPSGFPLKGTAVIVSEESATEEQGDEAEDNIDTEEEYDEMADDNVLQNENDIDMVYSDKPYSLFMTSTDTSVIAAGVGTVVRIQNDSTFGCAIKINHDNGYYSIYRGKGVPLVTEGTVVSEGCILMTIVDDNSKFLYQIIFMDSYQDPMEIMEING